MRTCRLLALIALASLWQPPHCAAQAAPRLTAAERTLVEGDNRFAIGLLRESVRRSRRANVFVSPLSFAMALGMTANGAAGATEIALQQLLGTQGLARQEANAAYHALTRALLGLDRNVTLGIANSIWYRDTHRLAPAFLVEARTWFGAQVTPLDFASGGAADRMNRWVSRETHGRINAIVQPPIPEAALMYLINAVYFKASWQRRFVRALTQRQPFRLDDGSTVEVPLMSHGAPVPVRLYADQAGAWVLDLPYGRGAFSMTVVLPPAGQPIDSLAAALTGERWSRWIAGLQATRIGVLLPRFRLELSLDSTIPVLRALGMSPAFCDEPGVDFTRMDPSGRSCISEVKHKTFVLVDESGTEAAAVTAVGVHATAVERDFRVDRPFLFAIRERTSGAILFIGCIRNPAAT